ncbi:MAG: rhombosortase [Gammaproteobacteria bacterium]|nr:rhombosortase [Gammaproteobacteria bacterium]NNL46233.1 rhombosortase [Woeseiaceae bacterium]
MGLDKLDRYPRATTRAGRWLLPVLVLLIAVLLALGGEMTRQWLRFDRVAIGSGEFWRLVSGHFVHLGWPHFALNGAGLVLVWYLVGDVYGWFRWILIGVFTVIIMDVGLWIFDPMLMWYVGLSGLLHGILAAGLMEKLRKPDTEALILMLLLLGKLAWEQFSGPLPGSESTAGGTVAVDSHLFGALGGVVGAILLRIRVRQGAAI